MDSVVGPRWAIIVHGGAKSIPQDARAAHTSGVLTAVARGQEVLSAGGSALDAVEAAIRQLEDDPTFNAGFGSVLNADGAIETDASIMDGQTLRIGAVAAASGLRHPISVARLLLPETAILLAGEGVATFAAQMGAERCAPEDLVSPATAASGGDTVGAVALDLKGRLAAGLSTGGLAGKRPGRVGDTPLPGCGFYADDEVGGVAFSGDGESIARVLLAAKVVARLPMQGAQGALEDALEHLARVGGEAGGIVLDTRGEFGCAHTSENFAIAAARSDAAPRGGTDAASLGDLIAHD